MSFARLSKHLGKYHPGGHADWGLARIVLFHLSLMKFGSNTVREAAALDLKIGIRETGWLKASGDEYDEMRVVIVVDPLNIQIRGTEVHLYAIVADVVSHLELVECAISVPWGAGGPNVARKAAILSEESVK